MLTFDLLLDYYCRSAFLILTIAGWIKEFNKTGAYEENPPGRANSKNY